MARQIDEPVQQSLLDRLIDDDPRSKVEPAPTRMQSVRMLKNSVRRDLEWLLNTRALIEKAPEAYQELAHSVFTFGLSDITSLSGDNPEDRNRLLRMIKKAIVNFEPRLSAVTVKEGSAGVGARQIRFSVQGLLRMDPNPEQVYFDTVLDLASGEYAVKGD